MALRVAVATGNWSNPAIWNGGVLPTVGDVVASNNFTVTIDQNINVDSITNSAQSIANAVPTMTSDNTPSGIVTASSFVSGFLPFGAFDTNINTEWRYDGAQWIAYEFTSLKAIDQYIFSSYTTQIGWTFEGWNGSSWVVLHTVTGVSVSGYTSPLLGNSTSYIKYRLNFSTTTLNQRVHTIAFYEYLGTSSAVAGGGFVLNSGVITTLTNSTGGIVAGPTNCVTYSAVSGTSTINGIVRGSSTNASVYGINYTGAANLNINGALTSGPTGNTNSFPVVKSGTGTLTIVGNVTASVGTNAGTAIYNSGTGTINITGNVYATDNSGYGHGIQNIANCTLNITGNIYGGNINSGNSIGVFNNQSVSTINIVGNVYGSALNQGVYTNRAGYLNIVGSLVAGDGQHAIFSGSSSAINILSGPFVCSPYGSFPYQVNRMHLIPSVETYLEFRDETTNGVGSPGAIAPATRMIAPAGVSDSPIPANVRFGITYANGSLVGTLRIPNTNSVAFGVEVDNTIGNAVITPQSVWDFAVANLTTMGSIGERLKKTSTVDSTGAQLSSFEF